MCKGYANEFRRNFNRISPKIWREFHSNSTVSTEHKFNKKKIPSKEKFNIVYGFSMIGHRAVIRKGYSALEYLSKSSITLLQGFLIFIFHVVRSKEIRAALEARRQRWQTSRNVSVANEKSTIGKGTSSTIKPKKVSAARNKISPEPLKNGKNSLPTVA